MAYSGKLPSYSSFRGKVPAYALAGNIINQNTLTDPAFGTQFPSGSGYFYYSYNGGSGDLIFQDPSGVIDIGAKKVIVFADSDVLINSKIGLTKGLGFFMLVARGDITVDPGVGGPQETPPVPDLEGVYYTDGTFSTGSGGSGLDEQLHTRGVIVALTKVEVDRIPPSSVIPGELFEFGPDQSMLIPPAFSRRNIEWREVLP
jgi:hypothetical protein